MWAGNRIPEYQDLLHLQLPGDGAYYVALFPRPRQEAVPSMSALANGKLIKVAGGSATDFAFLSADPAEASAEGVFVKGTAAVVQVRPEAVTLSLGAEGEVRHRDMGLAGRTSASLRADQAGLVVTVMPSAEPQEFQLTAPGQWSVAGGTIRTERNGTLLLTLPHGATSARLTKK